MAAKPNVRRNWLRANLAQPDFHVCSCSYPTSRLCPCANLATSDAPDDFRACACRRPTSLHQPGDFRAPT